MEIDTIVAVVTPPGEGGVGMVRASGPLCGSLSQLLVPQLSGTWTSHRLRHGQLVDPRSGRVLDSAMSCLMRAPRSYTGEDVFEIHCHGSPLVLELVLRCCLDAGCRLARPGEFTLRAFLNGKIDLSQAEAVLDIVRARTGAGLDLAIEGLSGWLSARVEPTRQVLIGALARMEAMVDFVEEDVPPTLDAPVMAELEHALGQIETLLEGAAEGAILRDGAALAIVGSPNVGKSSIMNCLVGADRSIVTPVPGTTRDTVEETIQIRDVPFRTSDTAGFTLTDDVVERIGVERSHRALQSADVALIVFDSSRPLGSDDALAIDAVAATAGATRRVVAALNKSDLRQRLTAEDISKKLPESMLVACSAVEVGGVDALRDALASAALGGHRHEFVVANVRHQDALNRAAGALREGLMALARGIPLDLVSFDIRAAARALGEISGRDVDDELLDRIFRDFCIGK